MTRPYSLAFKEKMVRRMVGRDATSATRLAEEVGVSQQALSLWLEQARSLPRVRKPRGTKWSVDEKVRILAAASKLSGEELASFLERAGLSIAEFEQWRRSLELGSGDSSEAAARRIRTLERELARKEKALAEAAALLILKKKLQMTLGDEDDDTEDPNDT
jgi:transposase